ncbi:MAG: sensor protein [Actinomycetia bacterium]|nr:sensor protein [Actinomycetes bacterium]
MEAAAPTKRVHLRFFLATGLAFLATGAVVLWFAERGELARTKQAAVAYSVFVADVLAVDALHTKDLRAPVRGAERARLDRVMHKLVLTASTLRVNLWSKNGLLTYSTTHELIGRHAADPREIAAVLRGQHLSAVDSLSEEGVRGPNTKSLETYVRIDVDAAGSPDGVLELYQDYAPVTAAVRSEMITLGSILLVALCALWIALFPLLRRTTAALERSLMARRVVEAELESTNEQLRQAQKMEAIGRLAGGVAHDFNNMLLAISGYTELALDMVDGRVGELLKEVRKASARAAELTTQLLAFSRQQVLQPQVLDLNAVVRDVERMLARLLGGGVAIDLSLSEPLPSIDADPGQITQVLLNLAVNARDAMSGAGTLTIATSTRGDHMLLAVTDTGVGMDAATRERLFEPFFTTKPVGLGTGLGLSTVYGIVMQSGGTIDVESTPGAGTTFRLAFPSASGSPVSVAPVLAIAPARAGRILVVDDDEAVRELVARMLRDQGHEAVTAGTAAEALAARGPWDLVVSDVVMPDVNGPELVRRLGATDHLLISGYDAHALVADGTPFLAKPFTAADLAQKVREALGAASLAA